MRLRVSKKDQNRITDELVDGASAIERNLGHLGQIRIDHLGQLLRLERVTHIGELHNVGEEHGQVFSGVGLLSGFFS